MKPKVYLESTIVSYFTARPSNDILVLARQRITEQWWQYAIEHFDMYVSALVEAEIRQGDPAASEKRIAAIKKFPFLEADPSVMKLYEVSLAGLNLPPKAFRDALHHNQKTYLDKYAFRYSYSCYSNTSRDYGGTAMIKDPIVEETRKAGENLAAEAGYDPKKFFAMIVRRQSRCRRKMVSFNPKRKKRIAGFGEK